MKRKDFSGTTKTQIGAKLLADNQCKKKKKSKHQSFPYKNNIKKSD